jgi:C4-dicarboxylate-specific signal transduction histidine kinase
MTDARFDDVWIEAANCLATVAHQLSSAAHEANNLLQVIAGSAEMIQLNPGNAEKVMQRASTVAEHAQRVSRLLGSVRELSKFEPPEPDGRTNMVALAESALDVRRHALTRARIAVSTAFDEPTPVARVGWRPAMQLLLNLILNAEQALDGRAAARIAIQVRRDADDVVVMVDDNGASTPAGESAPFKLREMPDGPPLLGIGLIAARWIAARDHGSIEVNATESGTTARLRLPAAREER